MKTRRYFNTQFLVALRRRAKETQSDLAAIVGVSLRTIQNWEGGGKSPERKNVAKIAAHYNVDETLFYDKAEKIAWQNYQYGIMMGHGTHDDHRIDALNLNAIPSEANADAEPTESEQSDSDLLGEGVFPNVPNVDDL